MCALYRSTSLLSGSFRYKPVAYHAPPFFHVINCAVALTALRAALQCFQRKSRLRLQPGELGGLVGGGSLFWETRPLVLGELTSRLNPNISREQGAHAPRAQGCLNARCWPGRKQMLGRFLPLQIGIGLQFTESVGWCDFPLKKIKI